MGFEPTISTVTGWRALRAAPRGHCVATFARRWAALSRSQVLANVAIPCTAMNETFDRLTARRRHARFGGFSLDARAYGVRLNDSILAARGIQIRGGSRGTRTHKRLSRHLSSKQVSHPAGWLPCVCAFDLELCAETDEFPAQ